MTKSVRRLSYWRGDLLLRFMLGASSATAHGSIVPNADVTMEIGETFFAQTRLEFRNWLRKNHARRNEIWLIHYKKATGKASLDYVEALEEAICYGWIDGLVKTLDAERYVTRFTPRRPRSHWTEANKDRARKMIAAGRMAMAGRQTLPKDL